MRDDPIILLAEDREDDVLLICRAFERADRDHRIQVVHDGDQAVAYLAGQAEYADRIRYPFPDLLLLDLKMPRLDGFEVLKWIRQHPVLSPLRVIVLTSSDQIRDVNLAYQLGANAFLVKPVEFEGFVQLVQMLEYWLQMTKAPQVPGPIPIALAPTTNPQSLSPPPP